MGSISLAGSVPAPLGVGDNLLDAMLNANLPAVYLCMSGACGRCRVTVRQGSELLTPPNRAEEYHGCTGPDRLACQSYLASDGSVAVTQG